MRIAFPHMGTLHVVLKTLFAGFGHTVLVPPPTSKRTLELGVRHSPEAVCLPFKIMLGNYIEALEQGADTLVTCGGIGPCRLGYYAQVQRQILEELDYQFEMLVIEPDPVSVWHNLRQVARQRSAGEIYSVIRLALAKMEVLDSLQREVQRIRPCEAQTGETDGIWQTAVQAVDAAATLQALQASQQQAQQRLEAVLCHNRDGLLRIGLVGEIFVMLEPFVNLDLVRRLGRLGVAVDSTMYLSDYVNGHLFRKREYLKLYQRLERLAQPYLGHGVGGHAVKSIARTVHMRQENYDGVIHVFPFTCMPEIVAKNILPQISDELGIPVLSLAFDEQSGEAGLVTRLEAFVDLLRYRRLRMPQPAVRKMV